MKLSHIYIYIVHIVRRFTNTHTWERERAHDKFGRLSVQEENDRSHPRGAYKLNRFPLDGKAHAYVKKGRCYVTYVNIYIHLISYHTMWVYVVCTYMYKRTYNIYIYIYARVCRGVQKKTTTQLGVFGNVVDWGEESALHRLYHIHLLCNPRREHPLAPFHPQIVKSQPLPQHTSRRRIHRTWPCSSFIFHIYISVYITYYIALRLDDNNIYKRSYAEHCPFSSPTTRRLLVVVRLKRNEFHVPAIAAAVAEWTGGYTV